MAGDFGLFAVVAVALFAGAAHALPPRKIVGGSTCAHGEFPYMVSLRRNGVHFCGGAIVSRVHIVTAAHCVVSNMDLTYGNFRVATGTTSTQGGTLHRVSKTISHKNFVFHAPDIPNDIAIVVLSAPIVFNDNQNSIALPTAPTPAGASAIATGWGLYHSQASTSYEELMQAHLQVLDNAVCQAYIRQYHTIRDGHICTFNGYGRGTCNGDSGGPLAYNGHLIGIVSFGIPCAVGFPDVYTDVYKYANWISTVMSNNPST